MVNAVGRYESSLGSPGELKGVVQTDKMQLDPVEIITMGRNVLQYGQGGAGCMHAVLCYSWHLAKCYATEVCVGAGSKNHDFCVTFTRNWWWERGWEGWGVEKN